MTVWKDKADFKNAVLDWASRLQIQVVSIYLRPMKNKWASCSTDGNLNFNSELLAIEKDLGEFVIVHELLHFKIPNHGKLWKSLMSAYLGDWEKLDNKLRAIHSASVVTSKSSVRRMAPAEKTGKFSLQNKKQ